MLTCHSQWQHRQGAHSDLWKVKVAGRSQRRARVAIAEPGTQTARTRGKHTPVTHLKRHRPWRLLPQHKFCSRCVAAWFSLLRTLLPRPYNLASFAEIKITNLGLSVSFEIWDSWRRKCIKVFTNSCPQIFQFPIIFYWANREDNRRSHVVTGRCHATSRF